MGGDDVRAALARWAARYAPRPAPWVVDGRQDPATMHLWVTTLAPLDPAIVTVALDTAADRWPDWPPSLTQLGPVIREVARSVRAERARLLALDTPGGGCDGTGWVPGDTGMTPCPRCNPWLAAEYRAGRTADTPDRRRRAAEWAADHPMPPWCVPPRDRPISGAAGREIVAAIRAGRADLAEAADARAAEEEPW